MNRHDNFEVLLKLVEVALAARKDVSPEKAVDALWRMLSIARSVGTSFTQLENPQEGKTFASEALAYVSHVIDGKDAPDFWKPFAKE